MKTKLLSLIISLFACSLLVAQEQPIQKVDVNGVYLIPDKMPEYPGGMAAALEYIQKNMRYPETAKKNGTQGRVTVQFIIDKGGNVTDPKVIRAVDKDLDAEAIRLIGTMPKWKPGMQKGQAVAVKYLSLIHISEPTRP